MSRKIKEVNRFRNFFFFFPLDVVLNLIEKLEQKKIKKKKKYEEHLGSDLVESRIKLL